jgi:hypothetical protein
LWITGFVSLGFLAHLRFRGAGRVLLASAAWITIGFLPYSFLTYMPHVPSRHTYIASAGLAFLVGAAALEFYRRYAGRPRVLAAVACIVLVHQCGYLWTRKHGQYLARAAPTERIAEYAATSEGPVQVKCFPYDLSLAQMAVDLRRGKGSVTVVKNATHGLDLCGGF